MVSTKKQEFVQALTKKVDGHPIVGIVNMQNLPAQQLQRMRATLKKQGVIMKMARKKLLSLILKGSNKDNIADLETKMTGMPALLLSTSNPFTLYKTIQKNKSEAPAKAGQQAPKDVMVKAGPTNFAPGPIISQLAGVGIKTKVEGGKLAIINDVVVAKEGGVISAKLAETLKRLDIKPMEIGLDLVAVWEDGTVFLAKQLHVDEAEYAANVTLAAQWAFNLAMECGITNRETTVPLVQKAAREALALAHECVILTKETSGVLLARAEAQATALNMKVQS